MAKITTPEVKVGISKGTTWGTSRDMTAANIAKLMHCMSIEWEATHTDFRTDEIGFDNFIGEISRLELSVRLTGRCRLGFDAASLQILAAFFGTVTASPAETTGGQGDYLHNLDMASKLDGVFLSLAALVEDDYVVNIPSFKVESIQIEGDVNSVPVLTWSGIGDSVVLNATAANTAAEVAALSYLAYNPAVFGAGANHYLRLNSQSGGSLAGGNALEISRFSVGWQRPFQERRGLRGLLSKYTKEPLQLSPTIGNFNFTLTEIDDSVIDGLVDWESQAQKKAELFIDGTAIGSGVNRSIKVQMPKLYTLGKTPDGYGVPNNASLMLPTLSYEFVKAASAPSGMSGVTGYGRIALINTRVQTYLN